MAAQLFIISTPIGNRKDITLRALESFFSVDVLLCEDTRITKQLLDFYFPQIPALAATGLIDVSNPIMPKLISYHDFNEEKRLPLIAEFFTQNLSVGLVSDAGTPLISDPGFRLIQFCDTQAIEFTAIPGVSAAITALTLSPLFPDRFLFLGFLPKKSGKQEKIWHDIQKSEIDKTIIFYESPFRLEKTLRLLHQIVGNVPLVLARELTKLHEQIISAPVEEVLANWKNLTIKGEFVVLWRYTTSP